MQLLIKVNVKGNGFGGLEVACWPLVLKFAGSNLAEAVRFFKVKKSSARLPRRGSKSHPVPCRRFAACKRTLKIALTRYFQAKFTGHFSPNSSNFHCFGRWRHCDVQDTWWCKLERLKISGHTISLQAPVHPGALATRTRH
jgi:hypothetical protein